MTARGGVLSCLLAVHERKTDKAILISLTTYPLFSPDSTCHPSSPAGVAACCSVVRWPFNADQMPCTQIWPHQQSCPGPFEYSAVQVSRRSNKRQIRATLSAFNAYKYEPMCSAYRQLECTVRGQPE